MRGGPYRGGAGHRPESPGHAAFKPGPAYPGGLGALHLPQRRRRLAHSVGHGSLRGPVLRRPMALANRPGRDYRRPAQRGAVSDPAAHRPAAAASGARALHDLFRQAADPAPGLANRDFPADQP
ncbi:hypothetical protein AAU61_08950 [Desulfocarbo indianensis]|nr:hypothetical protein AAU61_08950 [Desulfocarbo indianensis]